ncbi:MAG: hypothetical protein A3J46_05865 [Candidatus Yanofskybacteria bacterium RIFCSPHIGHO2_02_FULL_41_11]|uniref:DUF4012 domain-containing protein n=1 Tax=Candidatus Yanofskybacteria bacterium RIFCSPHIGHO2_02_FULL_41_11 TaxID=1802675 RepID=A0A1F8F787_9BACT|nr:MAG: hypothetical protein A3J46_05865 [Candidatus Yanofskybacteria bacterium RIFCSPHIGHO2_02_FULL_41_11]
MENKEPKFSLFDIKPIDESGVVEFVLEPVIKLKRKIPAADPIIETVVLRNPKYELENVLNSDFDFRVELISIGGKIHEQRPGQVIEKPKIEMPKPVEARIISERVVKDTPLIPLSVRKTPLKEKHISISLDVKKALLSFSILIIGFAVWQVGSNLKADVVQSGNSAVANLEQARLDLESFNIDEAILDFSNAYEEFSRAEDSLNFMGSILGSVLAEIPGNSQYKSARNLVEAGKIFSQAGQSLAQAANLISQTSLVLSPGNSGITIVSDLKNALVLSQADIHKAAELLADVDETVIPEEKRQSFLDFKSKLPEITKLIDNGVEYSRFLENLIAFGGSKKYIILFQNPSELRPTGGFPGSYAIMHFQDGQLKEFKIDDVYNLDGQLKENVIPPKELQHITPTWAMRDANWFIDFPASARKIMEFFKKEAGYEIDGVITFNPLIVGKMLEVLGPIELPDYDLTLTADNFLQEIQAEVEYGENRTQPKTVLYEFGPKLLEKLYNAQPNQWVAIFDTLFASLESKDMPMYFNDLRLQSFALEKGFAGQVKDVPGDYLMVTATNIKGSKTDIITDTAMKLESEVKGGEVIHKLSITRKHNGGKHKYGFYNRQNPSYIRVLVPEGSELISIDGISRPSNKPLVDYDNLDFEVDDDLAALERSEENKDGYKTYEESGKTGFGFWVVIDPGQTKTTELVYKVPLEINEKYELYIQKQPGLTVDNFDIVFDLGGKVIRETKPFTKDLDLEFTFQ